MFAKFPVAVENLINAFRRLPGIGEKTATRLTFYLIRSSAKLTTELGLAVSSLKKDLRLCPTCRHICDTIGCQICQDPKRDTSKICVVAESIDILAFERAGIWSGVYHVLHGVLNPLEGIGSEHLAIAELLQRVSKEKPAEIILALNPSIEGEATATYLTRELAPYQVKTTRIARGLPTGSELSYADEITLRSALTGRREL